MMDALRRWAGREPGRTAVTLAHSGEALSYAALDAAADRVARMLQDLGVREGDTIALLHDNALEVLSLWWGARRAGVYYVPLGVRLRPTELGYIVRDCAASLIVATGEMEPLATELAEWLTETGKPVRVLCTGASATLEPMQPLLSATNAPPAPARLTGREMIYSSGTTGRPKGVRRDLVLPERAEELPVLERAMRRNFRIDDRTIYLSLAPLYHATGRFLNRAIESGGAVVIAVRFDPEAALAAIEQYRVTHSQWVPTMFTRLLALSPETRTCYDLSSHRVALHAAAPCPIPVKRAMIDWWGPIVDEYYGGSENAGVTFITAAEWLEHVSSVGRSISGAIHILKEDGSEEEVPAGEIGLIYFEGGVSFRYTEPGGSGLAATRAGYTSYGDLGHVDEDGYLYISDRRTDLIISGGVNVYPKEIELVLEMHPAVREVAVIGIPDAEFGQQVKAIVCPVPGHGDEATLGEALIQFCRAELSSIKVPRSIAFVDELPRNDNGKLLKRELRERYLPIERT